MRRPSWWPERLQDAEGPDEGGDLDAAALECKVQGGHDRKFLLKNGQGRREFVREACRRFGISRKTGYKSLQRYRQQPD